jgi:hypothetical protein
MLKYAFLATSWTILLLLFPQASYSQNRVQPVPEGTANPPIGGNSPGGGTNPSSPGGVSIPGIGSTSLGGLSPLPQVHRNPISGDPNNPAVTSFVFTVCTASSDFSSDCWSSGGMEATKKLVEIYLKTALSKVVDNSLTLRFPVTMTNIKQTLFLQKLEATAIKAVTAELKAQVLRLTPIEWKVEDNRKINEWAVQADTRASTGTNWSHDWSLNSHTFGTGSAYNQLQHINFHGWGGS